jgi:hypothetical protein
MMTRTLSSIPTNTTARTGVAASHSPEPKRRVYLAGKMHGASNWRLPLVPQLGIAPFGEPVDCGRFIFTGPHFVPFGGNSHEWVGWHAGVYQHESTPAWRSSPSGRPRWIVPALCQEWLRQSDLFFAWINATDCHATLLELGWAHMLGKPVYLAFSTPELAREMWFARKCPRTTAHVHDSPAEALERALAWEVPFE